MRPMKLGLCLPILEDPLSGTPPRWEEIRRLGGRYCGITRQLD